MIKVTIFVITLFLLPLFRVPSARAQTPTVESTVMPMPPKIIEGKSVNKPIDKSEGGSFVEKDEKGNITKIIDALSFTFGGGLTAPANFNVSDYKPILKMFQPAVPFLTPLIIQQQAVDTINNLYVTGKARLCVQDPVTGEWKKSPEDPAAAQPYRTKPVPELGQLAQGLMQVAPAFSRFVLSPNGENKFDFRFQPEEIAKAPECGEDDKGTEQEAKAVEATGGTSFVDIIMGVLRGLLGGGGQESVTVHAEIDSKQNIPKSQDIFYLLGRAHDDMDRSNVDANTADSGGIANSFATLSQDPNKKEFHGEQDNSFSAGNTKTRVWGSKAAENSKDFIGCSLTTRTIQQVRNTTTTCAGF
ncbi:hypothetical protein HY948_01920 [Candidatus Gottesmanbacteria bacterium]|nr:hypothetical protein [Candidatus Gottesmanbacteria bacterium]